MNMKLRLKKENKPEDEKKYIETSKTIFQNHLNEIGNNFLIYSCIQFTWLVKLYKEKRRQ